MTDKVVKTYHQLFKVHSHEALTQAVDFLIRKKKARNNADIAKKVGVSASTLAAYMSGTKKISETFIEKFNLVFQIDLVNPLTYDETPWIQEMVRLAKDGHFQPVSAYAFLQTYITMRQSIGEQQLVIEGLKRTNKELNKLNVIMYDYLVKTEQGIIEAIITGKLPKPH